MDKDYGKIGSLPTTDIVHSRHPDATVRECLEELQKASVGGIVIVRPATEEVEGIFTERDYLMKIAGKEVDIDVEPVSRFMTPHPVCLKDSDDISLAIIKMRFGKFRHIIVVNDDRQLRTIISARDILEHVVDHQIKQQ